MIESLKTFKSCRRYLAGILAILAMGCGGDALNPVGDVLLDRAAGGVREVLDMPTSSTRRIFERIETLEPPITNLRVGNLNGFLFRSLLKFEIPEDSLRAAAGGVQGDPIIDSLRVVIGWRPQANAYLFHSPSVGPFEVHRPLDEWNEASSFFDDDTSVEVPFASEVIPGLSVTRTDTTAVLTLSAALLEPERTGVESLELLLEPLAGEDYMLAAFSSEAGDSIAGVISPRIVVDYHIDTLGLRYESLAVQDISWGVRSGGGPPDDLLMISSGLRLSPVLQFAIPDTVPASLTVNLARFDFDILMSESLFDVLPIQLDAISVASTGDTVFTTFATSTLSVLAFDEPVETVALTISQAVIRNWASGARENLGMAIRPQFDSNFGWVVMTEPRISFIYSLIPEAE